MAKKIYIGVNGEAKEAKEIYIGVNGEARKIKKAYIGDSNNRARLVYKKDGLITFGIIEWDNTSGAGFIPKWYNAKLNMTWEDWVKSEYNTGDYRIDIGSSNSPVYRYSSDLQYTYYIQTGLDHVNSKDYIIEDHNYTQHRTLGIRD